MKPHKYFVFTQYPSEVTPLINTAGKAIYFKKMSKLEGYESDFENANKTLELQIRKERSKNAFNG